MENGFMPKISVYIPIKNRLKLGLLFDNPNFNFLTFKSI